MHDIRSTVAAGGRHVALASKTRAAGLKNGSLGGITVRREEARRGNQRQEDRYLKGAEPAVVTLRGLRLDVGVVNVSKHGTMIAADFEAHIGERLDIQFADCNPTRCVVRWVRAGRIGLEFESETVVIGIEDGLMPGGRRSGEQTHAEPQAPRRQPRLDLSWHGKLQAGTNTHHVRLRNISAAGAMLDSSENVEPTTRVVLELAGASSIKAQVRWCRSGQIGIVFDQPYDVSGLLSDDSASSSERV